MKDALEVLKDCNIELTNSISDGMYRYVAHIIYSTRWNCFIVGVEQYSNDEFNSVAMIASSKDENPLEAAKRIHAIIMNWCSLGGIPWRDMPADGSGWIV